MEVNIKDVHRFIEIKTVDMKYLTEQFTIWFRSQLLSVDLLDTMTVEQMIIEQETANALCDKIDYMIENTFGGKCDMDSIFRLLVRICDKGMKLIPDMRSKYEIARDSGYNSRKLPYGHKRLMSHFRWNHRTYVLHKDYITKLAEIVNKTKYFEFNPDANMCSLEINEDF